MHINKFVIGVLALATTAIAFHPWFPAYLCLKEGTCKPEKRSISSAIPTLGAEDNNDGLELKLVRRVAKLNTNQLIPRATVTAQTPTQTDAAGVDQDGGDVSYFAEILFGSNKTPLLMLLDSGGSQTWVKSSSCQSAACTTRKTFGPGDSSTLEPTTQTFSIAYGSGSVNGSYFTDTISFADLDFRMDIGLATYVSDSFLSFAFDGILGLAQDVPSFVDSLIASKQLKSNIFGLSLTSMEDGPNTSEISFGAPDLSKFTGSLSYSAVNATNKGYWTITLENAGFGNAQMGSLLTTPVVYIDTGSTYMFAPEADVKSFYSLIPGSQPSGDDSWTVPCGTTTPLTFTFAGVTYSIPAKDWVGPMANGVCLSNLYLMAGLDGWLLGDIYLRQVYSVFDADLQRIGFASAITPTSVATSGTTQSTSTGTGPSGSMTLGTTASNATPTGKSQSTGSSSGKTDGHPSTATAASATSPLASATKNSGAYKINTAMTTIMAVVLISAIL